MQEYILVINCGSSSLKYQLIKPATEEIFAKALIDRIGLGNSNISHSYYKNQHWHNLEINKKISNHREAFEYMTKLLCDNETKVIENTKNIKAIGHRVVHGGAKYTQAQVLTEEVKQEIRKLIPLAPLHNPAHLLGIEAGETIFPYSIHYAVFDTSFHTNLPEYSYLYAIPKTYADRHNIRVYGFHGISHEYVYSKACEYFGRSIRAITAHLGNGSSITAINEQGYSIDTSMGLSPLAGLIMGTRCGDIDPAVIFYMYESLGLSIEEIKNILSKESGMLGLAGSNDARDIGQKYLNGDSEARLCYQMYSHRIQKYIGAYYTILGGIDALIFTGGIGENDYIARELICKKLGALNCYLDEDKNKLRGKDQEIREIHSGKSQIPILVIQTNEELSIAKQAEKLKL